MLKTRVFQITRLSKKMGKSFAKILKPTDNLEMQFHVNVVRGIAKSILDAL